MKQSRIFEETEGFKHFERNGSKPNKVIIETITKLNLYFERCLEIGCADGATLAVLKDYYPNAKFVGIEASGKVLENAILKEGISYLQSTAECLPNFDENTV